MKFIKAQLFRANFNGSNLDRASMSRAYLGYTTFNLYRSNSASLQGTHVRGTNLHDAEFREADLTASIWGDVLGRGYALLDNAARSCFRELMLLLTK